MCLKLGNFLKEQSTSYGAGKDVRLPYPALKVIWILVILGLLASGIVNLVYQRGGQKVVPLIATTLLKVKGIAAFHNGTQQPEVWDASDVVYPALENGATFITTSFYRWEQSRGNCSGLLPCSSPTDCDISVPSVDAGGLLTGVCNPNGFCEVISWCPVEEPEKAEPPNELEGIPSFTIFVRNFVGFPSANDGFDTGNDLNHNWNFFAVSDLLQNVSVDYNSIKSTGTVLVVSYDYKCNLDIHSADKCKTKAKTRVVQLGVGKDGAATTGFNFRKEDVYETYNSSDNSRTFTRLLQKLYGIRYALHQFIKNRPSQTLRESSPYLRVEGTPLLHSVAPKCGRFAPSVQRRPIWEFIDRSDCSILVDADTDAEMHLLLLQILGF